MTPDRFIKDAIAKRTLKLKPSFEQFDPARHAVERVPTGAAWGLDKEADTERRKKKRRSK